MTIIPVVAPYVPNYASRTSYISVQDYLKAPTGTDTTQLLPGGTPAENRLAIAGVIERASNAADVYCQKILAATVDTQSGRYRMYRDGTIRVPVDYTPVIMVTGVSVAWEPQSMTASTDLSAVWIQEKVIQVPVLGSAASSYAPMVRGRSYDEV